MKCPSCEGRGAFLGLLDGPLHQGPGSIPCGRCHGSGSVSADDLERYHRGKSLRADRIRRGLTMEQEAKRLGVTAEEVSNRERGY